MQVLIIIQNWNGIVQITEHYVKVIGCTFSISEPLKLVHGFSTKASVECNQGNVRLKEYANICSKDALSAFGEVQ